MLWHLSCSGHTDRDFHKHHHGLGFSQFGTSHSVSSVCHPCLFLMVSCMMFNEIHGIYPSNGYMPWKLCHLSLFIKYFQKEHLCAHRPTLYMYQNKRALEKILFSKTHEEELVMNTSFCLCVFFGWLLVCFLGFFNFFFNCSLVPMEWIEIVTQFYGDNSSRTFLFIRPQQHFMYKIQCGV